jgi:ATP-dependent helicase/nuclease subunit A
MSEPLGEIDYTEEEYLNLGSSWNEAKLQNEIDIIDTAEIDKTDEILKETEEVQEEEEQEPIEDIELEAKFVANKIRELVDSKFKICVKNKETDEMELRPIEYRDIAILMHSPRNVSQIFEQELIKKDISVYSDTSESYLNSMEINQIISLLKIV